MYSPLGFHIPWAWGLSLSSTKQTTLWALLTPESSCLLESEVEMGCKYLKKPWHSTTGKCRHVACHLTHYIEQERALKRETYSDEN